MDKVFPPKPILANLRYKASLQTESYAWNSDCETFVFEF